MVSRIEQGEELKHGTLTGVVGHVDGQGQCFIDTRNLLNKIDDGPKIAVKVKHMRALLFDMQCRQEQKTMIDSTCVWVDNTAAIAVATGNDFTHETVKHVTVKVRFIQECVQRQMILIAYIKTSKNIADIMTKQSAGPQFAQHRD